MRKTIAMAMIAIMTTVCAQAQKIQTVDREGNPIPLVNVLTEEGVLIGTTGIDGTLADVRGAKKVALTHVAYKPQIAVVASLQGGRITMEDQNYGLEEITVKPKQYIYVETFYRTYVYREDSLVYFRCGIMPNAYDPLKKESEHGSKNQAMTEYAPTMGFAINWGARIDVTAKPGKVESNGFPSPELLKKKYLLETTDTGKGNKTYSNAEGLMGQLVVSGNQARMSFDGARVQMYANKAKGETKLLQTRQERGYEYQYTLIHNAAEDGEYDLTNYAMSSHHWGYNDKKSHVTIISETYATDHGYMDKAEFKAIKKEIKNEHNSCTLESLEAYAVAHGVPALSPTVLQSVMKLKHWR